MTDLYEAGDINQTDGPNADVNDVDDVDDIDEADDESMRPTRSTRASVRATSSRQSTAERR